MVQASITDKPKEHVILDDLLEQVAVSVNLPVQKPGATWIPDYDKPDDTHVAEALLIKDVESEDHIQSEDAAERESNEKTISTLILAGKNDTRPWSDLDTCGRIRRLVVSWIFKPLALLTLLYLFICSLTFLSSAFRLLGGKAAGHAFSDSALLQNPITGLMIGILVTVLVQSSSTSTSIVVTMVASGILEVRPAIPIIMGANIGTSVTNTIVAMAQSSKKEEFRLAFAGATVHDMFNWLSVIFLLPLEAATGYLYRLTSLMVGSYNLNSQSGTKRDFLKALTKPFTDRIIRLDKDAIEKIALGDKEYESKSMIKRWCEYDIILVNSTVNATYFDGNSTIGIEDSTALVEKKIPHKPCDFLFNYVGMNDTLVGLILLMLSLAILCGCLICIVKLLNSILRGQIAKVIKKTLNSDLPGKCSYFTDYIAILIGAVMTFLVQSSSVFTSAMTPLVGIGVIELERMYPLTLGSNIGTTTTGLLAAMAASGDKLEAALQIALCHLLFNISGILLFFPVPALRFPIRMARTMGNVTAEYRWFAVVYLAVMFFLIPGLVFALSTAGFIPFAVVLSTITLILILVIILNVLQNRCHDKLPAVLRNWNFLPEYLHSLAPYDRLIQKLISITKRCCPCCCTDKKPENDCHAEEMITIKVDDSSSYVESDFITDSFSRIKETQVSTTYDVDSAYNSTQSSLESTPDTSRTVSRDSSQIIQHSV